MIDRIGKVTVYVNNQEKAKKFWTEKINFKVKFEQPMGPNMKWLEVGPKENDTTLILYDKSLMQHQNPSANTSHPSVILSTPHIDSTYNEIKSKGVEVGELKNMPYGKMFSFKDQDENEYLVREDN